MRAWDLIDLWGRRASRPYQAENGKKGRINLGGFYLTSRFGGRTHPKINRGLMEVDIYSC
jgi:hypothetical protein